MLERKSERKENFMEYFKNNKVQVIGLALAIIAAIVSLCLPVVGLYGGIAAVLTFIFAGVSEWYSPSILAKSLMLGSGLIATFYTVQLLQMIMTLMAYGLMG